MHDFYAPMIIMVTLVMFLTFTLTVLTVTAYRRSRDPRLLMVAGAFALLFVRNLTIDAFYILDFTSHGNLEIMDTIFDLGIALLLIAPFLKKW